MSHRITTVQSYKECQRCKETKSSDEFHRRSQSLSLPPYCKACDSDRARERYQSNPERWREQSRLWRMENPEKALQVHRDSNIRRYGIEPAEYDAILQAQGGVCAICEKPCKTGKRLSIDHDHKTGRVRGLLCSACNRGIGNLHDDPDLLIRAADYVRAASALAEQSEA